jgi:hypothetical protein
MKKKSYAAETLSLPKDVMLHFSSEVSYISLKSSSHLFNMNVGSEQQTFWAG